MGISMIILAREQPIIQGTLSVNIDLKGQTYLKALIVF